MRLANGIQFLSNYLQNYTAHVKQEIQSLPEEEFSGNQLDDIADTLEKKYTLEPIIIHWDQQSIVPIEEILSANSVAHDTAYFMGLNRLSDQEYKQQSLRYHVPITGDVSLIKLTPSTINMSLPNFIIEKSELTFIVPVSSHNRSQAKINLENYKKWIKQHVDCINQELTAHNQAIRTIVVRELDKRRNELFKLSSLIDHIGIPLKKIETSKHDLTPLSSTVTEQYYSVAISVGGKDFEVAAQLNTFLESNGVKTWFFPDDAKIGQRLHKTMYEMANEYDRVILICSKSSLEKNGVLNEIEEVLAREARNGGRDILLPISLDDYVFTEWSPERRHIAIKIRDKVIGKLMCADFKADKPSCELLKILEALRIEKSKK